MVVVYKIDRLSRSLLDFASLQTVFDEHQVSFVSVTQDINTSTSSGRMMLNILMTFAQYEREIITERIKDKIGAAKKRGKFCGGSPVLGYDVEPTSKKLLVNPQEAETVKRIFQDYLKLGSARDVAESLERDGVKTKSRVSRRGRIHGGGSIDAALVYRTLTNPIYIGQVRHLEQTYPGEHEAIIPQKLWNQAQELLALHTVHDGKMEKRLNPFRGLIRCGYCNGPLSLSATQKSHGKHYQYYVCRKDLKRTRSECPLKRVPAAELEKLLMNEIAAMLATPTMTAHIQSAAKELSVNGEHLKPKQVNEAFRDLKTVWDVMFPGERYKFIHAIVREVTITIDSVRIEYNVPGLEQILKEAGVEIDG